MRQKTSLFLLLLLLAIAPVVESQTTRKSLPDAGGLIEKHLTAVGGKKKMLALRSQHFKMSIVTMAGRKIDGEMEIHFARIRARDEETGKMVDRTNYRFEMEQGGFSQIIASDGVLSWSRTTSAQGESSLSMLSKSDASMYLNMFDPSTFARYKRTYKSWKTLRKSMINGRPAYEVKMVSNAGVREHYFFDVKNGLMVSLKSFIDSPAGEQVSKTSFSDYRDVNGILTPFKTTGEGTAFKQVSSLASGGGYNVKIAPKVFKAPADVLALAKRKKPKPVDKTKDKKRQ